MSASPAPARDPLAAVRDEQGFPADPDFPQLEIASDPMRMLAVFRAHLQPVDGKTYRVEDCIPFRFRCGRSTSRCVLQYTLRLVEPRTGRRWEQWVTGVLYAEAGEAERRWREMRAAEPRAEIPARWLTLEPVAFVPDLQMVVQVFPYDVKLRNLRSVMSGALQGLEPLLLTRLGAGQWHAEGGSIEPTRYRTELGAALKWTIQARDALTARRATLHCYLKVYRNDHGGETFQLLESLAERRARGEGPYSVVRPIAYSSELRTLALEEAPGTPLQQVLLQSHDPAGVLRAVARAVAAFNQDDVGITRRDSLTDQLDDVQGASRLLQWACPQLSAEVRAITAAVVQGLEDVPPAPIHRDLKTDHIFLSGDRVTFIDLDSVALGDPVRDPAHLFAHIAGRVGLDSMPRDQARAAAGTFVAEYFRCVPPAWRRRLPVHCAGALLEVARGIFKRQEPRWREKVAVAIAEAGRTLDS